MKFGESWNRNRYNSLCQGKHVISFFFLSVFFSYPFACGAPGQRANNCTWCHSKLKFKYDWGFSCERCQLRKQKAQVFAQTWKSQIKSQSTIDQNYSQRLNIDYLLDSAAKIFKTDVLQLKLCLEISVIQQLSHSKTTAFSKWCFAI